MSASSPFGFNQRVITPFGPGLTIGVAEAKEGEILAYQVQYGREDFPAKTWHEMTGGRNGPTVTMIVMTNSIVPVVDGSEGTVSRKGKKE